LWAPVAIDQFGFNNYSNDLIMQTLPRPQSLAIAYLGALAPDAPSRAKIRALAWPWKSLWRRQM